MHVPAFLSVKPAKTIIVIIVVISAMLDKFMNTLKLVIMIKYSYSGLSNVKDHRSRLKRDLSGAVFKV